MIRNLLTLIFLSATTFASAQLINIVELNSATENIRHVYVGVGSFNYSYGDYSIGDSSDIWILGGSLITNDGHPDVDFPARYEMLPGFVTSTNEYLSTVGVGGLFYNSQGNQIAINPRHYLASTGALLQMLRLDPEWDNIGDTTWMTVECSNKYSISYNVSNGRASVVWWESDGQGNFINPRPLQANYYNSIEDAYAAIQDHIIETTPCITGT